VSHVVPRGAVPPVPDNVAEVVAAEATPVNTSSAAMTDIRDATAEVSINRRRHCTNEKDRRKA
jgi:hypothetical protein